MIDVETTLEPPPFSTQLLGEEPDVDVTIWITETGGTRRMASVTVSDPSDAQLAEALISCLRGVATMRGPGLVEAVDRRIL